MKTEILSEGDYRTLYQTVKSNEGRMEELVENDEPVEVIGEVSEDISKLLEAGAAHLRHSNINGDSMFYFSSSILGELALEYVKDGDVEGYIEEMEQGEEKFTEVYS